MRASRAAMACLVITIPMYLTGCAHHHQSRSYSDPPPPRMLGSRVDEINMTQEINAEASKFVVYAHEFELNEPFDPELKSGWRLNDYGQDHVKQIAANIMSGTCGFPVVVERSQTSAVPSQYGYPVHFNTALDAKRRQVVVSSLYALGVTDAEQRVLVAPAFAEGITAPEASRAYNQGLSGRNSGSGMGFGFGGGFGLGGFGF